METEVREERLVGLEEDIGSVLLLRCLLHVADEAALLERHLAHLPVAATARHEAAAQSVHCFQTHAVHAHGGGEDGGVVLRSRVQLGDRIFQ